MVEAAGTAREGAKRAISFRGITQLALDAKGRLAIPIRYREALQAQGCSELVITADTSNCLLIYPPAEWEPIETQLGNLTGFDPFIRNLQRRIVGHASDVEIDAAGRILIPPALRYYARLDKHVALVGQGRRLELWDERTWQDLSAQPIELPATGLPSELVGFKL